MARKKRPDGTRAPNGASTVYYSEYDGKWHGRVTVGIRDNGRPDRRHVKRKTEAEAFRAIRDLESKRAAGKVRKTGPAWTVETWLTHWVENVAAPTVRRTTMVGYRSSVYNHLIPGVGAHRLDRLRPEHLEALYQRLQAESRKGKDLSLPPSTWCTAPSESRSMRLCVAVTLSKIQQRSRRLRASTRMKSSPSLQRKRAGFLMRRSTCEAGHVSSWH